MTNIFINLKRFEVPKHLGGICPQDDPQSWIEWVIGKTLAQAHGYESAVHFTFFLGEGLIHTAINTMKQSPHSGGSSLSIGSQGVHWQDITPGGNFGAFTSLLPAKAAKALNCTWTIIGHSEERKAKIDLLYEFSSSIGLTNYENITKTLNTIVNREVLCALKAGLNVLLCVGETEQEKGPGNFEDQKLRIKAVLKEQLEIGLESIETVGNRPEITIGYEPIWAIGPGKTPPGADYIGFVSSHIKRCVNDISGFTPSVVYGGGLKEDNAEMIAGVKTIDGGLVALTRFSGDIGFYPDDLWKIVEKYMGYSK